MSERFTIDVLAQFVGDPRIAVLDIGADSDGQYATVMVGSHPHSTQVRLRVGVPHPLGVGRALHLVGVAPAGHRAAAAMEITGPDDERSAW